MFGSAHFALSRGVTGLDGPAAWLNGLLLKAEEGLAWQQLIPYNLQVEQQRLQVRPAGEPSSASVPHKESLAARRLAAHAVALPSAPSAWPGIASSPKKARCKPGLLSHQRSPSA